MIATIVGQIVLGWLLADFLGGVFHWWEDRIGNPNTPIIGKWIVIPNRLHHDKPLYFIQNGTFWSRNRALIVLSLIVGTALSLVFGFSPFIAALMIGGAFTNEVHAWAHRPSKAPKWVRVLQETGLLQSPKGHAKHHKPPLDKNYCILTDLLNPFLDKMKFFPRLERVLRRA
jgi:ubiquitin-conjugating enzyme E2 variant